MKQLIFLCLIALIACSTHENDPQPKVPDKFDSIVGDWTFKGTDVSGEMSIAEFSGDLVVDNVGSFTIKGVQYSIVRKGKINSGLIPGTLQSLFLIHNDETYFGLHDLDINSSFTQITATKHSYSTPTTFIIGDKITLNRK